MIQCSFPAYIDGPIRQELLDLFEAEAQHPGCGTTYIHQAVEKLDQYGISQDRLGYAWSRGKWDMWIFTAPDHDVHSIYSYKMGAPRDFLHILSA